MMAKMTTLKQQGLNASPSPPLPNAGSADQDNDMDDKVRADLHGRAVVLEGG
jgi:hypothetical protein